MFTENESEVAVMNALLLGIVGTLCVVLMIGILYNIWVIIQNVAQAL